MTSLIAHRSGQALEPSAGEGHLSQAVLRDRPGLSLTSLEIDRTLDWALSGHPRIQRDFFSVKPSASYDVVVANPPYVPWKNVRAATRNRAARQKSMYHQRVNLYQLFMDAAIDHLAPGGEMVFVVPGEWVHATVASPLREKMARSGALTHFVHCGEERLFLDADLPFLCILRFVKGESQKEVQYWRTFESAANGVAAEPRTLLDRDNRWMMLPTDIAATIESWSTLSEHFDVCAGLVSGADDVFRVKNTAAFEPETIMMQVSSERTLVPYLFLDKYETPSLIPEKARVFIQNHRARLLSRRSRKFSELSYHRYAAVRNLSLMESTTERFFASVRTRNREPFFTVSGATHFNGAVFGIFRKESCALSVKDTVALLNSPRYRIVLEGMLLVSGEKTSLQHATISDLPVPRSSAAIREFLA